MDCIEPLGAECSGREGVGAEAERNAIGFEALQPFFRTEFGDIGCELGIVLTLERGSRLAFQNGYDTAFARYEALNREYIDELRRPRFDLGVPASVRGEVGLAACRGSTPVVIAAASSHLHRLAPGDPERERERQRGHHGGETARQLRRHVLAEQAGHVHARRRQRVVQGRGQQHFHDWLA